MTDQRLHLLVHDLAGVPRHRRRSASPVVVRRAFGWDEPGILALDSLAFDPTWQLGPDGYDRAMHATPAVRNRVATRRPDRALAGYAVSGLAGRKGYLQRLGVAPDHRRQGVATALVLDALAWMRRHGAEEAIVNTQVDNLGALALYLNMGFVVTATTAVPR